MTVRPAGVTLAAVLATLGMAVGACGGGPASTASRPSTSVVSSSPSTTTVAAPPKNLADQKACDSMETLMARMASAAQGWVPAAKPFDRGVEVKIRLLTNEMPGIERTSGTPQIRDGMHQSTVAFNALSLAMAGTSKDGVLGAVSQTRVAYSHFKRMCGLA